jgi:AMP-polyphosphate phosphotransferase
MSFDIGTSSPTMDKDEWRAIVPGLRERLLDMQHALHEAKVPTVFIMAGADGVKSQTVNRLVSWFDPRGLDVEAFELEDERLLDRPRMWLYVSTLPARGRIGLYFGSWYRSLVRARVEKTIKKKEMRRRLAVLDQFERSLVAEGYLVVKIWFELTEEEQRARLEALTADPDHQWKVLPQDWTHLKHHRRFAKARRAVEKHANSPGAEWTALPAADDRWREVAAAELFLKRAEEHCQRLAIEGSRSEVGNGSAPREHEEFPSPFDNVDLSQRLDSDAYDEALAEERNRLRDLSLEMREAGQSAVLVFEGWDAAGKGGAIRRLTDPMDARSYRVIPIGAPTDEERLHHYLWRFWRHVPRAGRMTLYDRSWYGRVLVERVEGFATEPEWRRAYDEIVDFEAQLAEHGMVVCKFWMHLSAEEQLRRFADREHTPHKRYKLTDEDWRNREKRPDYEAAVSEMYHRTHREDTAPWYLVPSEDKHFARVFVMRTVADRLEAALD